ncbi:MAG: carboxypeptidase M32 [Planctomycetota bacterium]
MSERDAYTKILEHMREGALLSSTAALVAWDQETGMPSGAGPRRAEQLALLAGLAHARASDERLGDWLGACEEDDQLDADQQANVRELRRDYDRATKLPADLVAELAATESRAQQAWGEARAKSDFASFAPMLESMVQLQQRKADCLKRDGQQRWDALADLYEPGMQAADLQELFGPLRNRLVSLRERLDQGSSPPAETLKRRKIAKAKQESFVRAVVTQMGFSLERGRIDESAHPFCTTAGGSLDVRLTTRFHDDDVLDALGSTMHEGGHGLYEQGLPSEPFGTPKCEAVSLGIHESQSRLWENHIGRSSSFWQWCWPLAQQHLGSDCGGSEGIDAHEAFRQSNRVAPSLIRVEADEATYDLHVMVRFEIEQALIAGELAIADLPAKWNALYRDYLGVDVPDDRRGCLQDVHWSCGLFGYFPTYTLGNLYAAQFAAAAESALGDLSGHVARGEFGPLREWLAEHVHRHGRRFSPAELCRRATGKSLSSEPFLDYLEAKLLPIYGV